MDRRIVAGLVGALLASLGGEASAQTTPARDPSFQPPVGMVPIRSINDSINSTEILANPGYVPLASKKVPTSPVGSGPAAVIPSPPVLDEPVSMTPIDPLHQSLTHGFAPGRVASLFRKPGARPTAPVSTTPSRFLPGYNSSPTLLPLTPAPRPSPYAGQSPETARPQADPVVVPASMSEGGPARPSPYVRDVPANARPQGSTDSRTPAARPRLDPPVETPKTTPTPAPAPAPTLPELPVEMPTPPALGVPSPMPEPAPTPPMASVGELVPSGLPVLEKIEPTATSPVVASEPPPPGLPPLEPVQAPAQPVAPAETLAAVPAADGPSKMTELIGAPTLIDSQVKRTSNDEAALRIKASQPKRELKFLTYRVAAVGNEIITNNELEDAVKLQMDEYTAGQGLPTDSPAYLRLKNQVAAMAFNHLIDERLILQEAKTRLRNGKGEQAIQEFVEKIWNTDELPALKHQYKATSVHELKIKLREQGKNYDLMKDAYCRKLRAQEFIRSEVRNEVSCDLMEQKAYYNAHLADYEKPARVTWREIEVNVRRYPDRATARKKADELLARLLHDESFEAIARTCSNGPTASQGGIYVDMAPGSYGISSVNDELNRLPIGQVSQVIEAPESFHIVRVDSRREKGPLHFSEVQDQIKLQVINENFMKAINKYLARLRAKTLIKTMYVVTPDGLVEASAATSVSKTDPAVQPASHK